MEGDNREENMQASSFLTSGRRPHENPAAETSLEKRDPHEEPRRSARLRSAPERWGYGANFDPTDS